MHRNLYQDWIGNLCVGIHPQAMKPYQGPEFSIKKQAKMKNSGNKGLLIPWLLEALNEQLYKGLKWSDKQKKLFYIVWTHKSAENWSEDVLEPFKAWAAHKGKLAGKNEKQLKATFRCALNSKKDELREVHRNRSQRFWQFVDPNSGEGKSVIKKRRKLNSKRVDAKSDGESDDRVRNLPMDGLYSAMDSCCEAQIFGSCILPSFESFLDNFDFSLLSLHEANGVFFSSKDFFKSSEEKTLKKKKRKVNRKLVDDIARSASPADIGNTFTNHLSCSSNSDETENSRTEKLPPFQSICSFQPLTPPYQDNEIPFSTPEHSTDFNTLTPEASPLTPPSDIPPKNNHNTSMYDSIHHQLSTDVWQPNCLAIPSVQQDFNGMNQFFLNDFDDFGKSSNQDLSSNKMDFLEMDQFVPVMNMSDNTLIRNGAFNYSGTPPYENNQCEQVKLEDHYFFSNDIINPEACESIIEELNRIPTSSEIGTYNYSS